MLQRKRGEKDFSADTLVELDEIRLKKYISNFNWKTYKQKRGTAIGATFAPKSTPFYLCFILKKRF